MSESLFDLDTVIDDVLDGTAEPAAREWLERRLATDSVARDRYDARAALFRALEGPAIADPPADLLPAVMREIGPAEAPLPRREPAGKPAGWWNAIAEAFRHRPARAWGYAATFAALAVALVLVSNRLPAPNGGRSLPAAGTIGAAGTRPAPRTLELTVARARVIAEARRGDDGLEVSFRAEAAPDAPVSVEITATPGDATLMGEGPGLTGPAAGTSLRFDDARFGVVRVRPERPGTLRLVIAARTPGGVTHGTLEIPAAAR